jgi:hypothetical protein
MDETANRRISNRRMTQGGFVALNLFINQTEYIPSSFVIRYSIIDLPAMP